MTERGADTALAALLRPDYLRTSWPWRALAYLVSTPLVAALALPLTIPLMPALALVLSFTSGGNRHTSFLLVAAALGMLALAAGAPLLAVPIAALERERLRLVREPRVVSGHRWPAQPGVRCWLVTRYGEAATWRDVGYVLLLTTVLPILYFAAAVYLFFAAALVAGPFVATPGDPIALGVVEVSTPGQAVPWAVLGAVLLLAVPYLGGLLAGAHGALATALLHDPPIDVGLRTELVEVERSRARLVDGFEAERRRIERDLHDGAQQRLVSLTLQLGLAKLDVPEGPGGAAVAKAHDEAKALMAELRDLIAGIHPQVLTDLGLPAALRDLAARTALPVTVHSDLGSRPAEHLESAAYFMVAEALTNAVRHGGAGAAWVRAFRERGLLVTEVTDDGRGGADPARGTGLTGLADRAAAVGGRMLLSSPPGGPTVVRVELPWIPAEVTA